MRLERLRVKGMWSFSQEPLELQDFATVNVIIGKNNTGKSNILRAIRWFSAPEADAWFGTTNPYSIPHTVQHREIGSPSAGHSELSVRLLPAQVDLDQLQKSIQTTVPNIGASARIFAKWFEQGYVLNYDSTWPNERRIEMATGFEGSTGLASPPDNADQNVSGMVNQWRQNPVNVGRHWCLNRFKSSTTYLDGWRSIDDHNKQIVKDIRVWQAPTASDGALMDRLELLEDFFQKLTRLDTATLRAEHTNDVLNIRYNKRLLPISSFGDGISHLLYMAYHFAKQQDHIFLIEEPETHLHPEHQRRLFEFIRELRNGNQYFITTHSPVLLDAFPESCIFRTDYDGHTTHVTRSKTNADVRGILDILDVRASDLLQTNLAIWVEGPTDRMFLLKCLELMRCEYSEGLDFQIVYFGGSLLYHLSVDDEVSGLINLLNLSRNVAFICDSDREADGTPLKPAVARIKEECKNIGGLFWATDGREVENYFPDEVINRTYQKILYQDNANAPKLALHLDRFENIHTMLKREISTPPQGTKTKVNYSENKAAVMPLLLAEFGRPDFNADLVKHLEGLIDKIRMSNTPALASSKP